ncbi:MAG TPA: hypothetical protein VM733_10190 [Thermoanaerobaculia bacterium]|nr:hypothetical protein [Thermoanaerobaculia bacterium]
MSEDLVLESMGSRARRFAFPVPDALLAVMYGLAAVFDYFPQVRDGLVYALFIEAGFLLMQGTLVDVATRLRKRPPVWLIPFIVAGVVLADVGGARGLVVLAWERGMLVFVPMMMSLLERGWILWQMPVRAPVQKMAARALISNRIVTGLALAFLTLGVNFAFASFGAQWPMLCAGAIYFGIAAFDDARVRGPRFAANPRVLFRYDVLGTKYLEPL